MPFHAAEQHRKVQENDSAVRLRISEAFALCEQYPSRGYKLQVIRILRISSDAASDWQPFF
jgi:hypothetical protein